MVVLEDIISNLESNGATIVSIDVDIDTITITYIDSSGTQQTVKYKITYNDDGSEDLQQIT